MFWLINSDKILLAFPKSHEQRGKHPLLSSDEIQARMTFVKDMRKRRIYFKDQDVFGSVYRADGSGLKVVCIFTFSNRRAEC